MRARLRYLWYRLTASLWLVPAVMIVGAVVLSFATLYLDVAVGVPWLGQFSPTLKISADGSRLLLSTIAGSMMTIATLAFSMTLVVMQLASSQLGPRLVTRLMSDRVNQIVLGTFIATFLYALLVLRTVDDVGEDALVPVVSVTVALVLAVISLGWLIYFIHHVAQSIQADTVIAQVSTRLDAAIDRLVPAEEEERRAGASEGLPEDFERRATSVASAATGYIQTIGYDDLCRIACAHDLLIAMSHRPGHFVIAGVPILSAVPAEHIDDEVVSALRGAIVTGPTRTPTQDIEFAISTLVDIGLRALSPGINDPHTAIACIDRLGAALARMMRRPPARGRWHDGDGRLRLVGRPPSLEGALDAAFNEIRQAAGRQVSVLIRLIESLTALGHFATTEEQRQALRHHAQALERACAATIDDPADRADAEARLEALHHSLG